MTPVQQSRSTPVDGTVVMSVKVPRDTAEQFGVLASTSLETVSSMLRRVIDAALAGQLDSDGPGPVELSTRAELDGCKAGDTRVEVAINLARRLDRDPNSAAAISKELRSVIADALASKRAAVANPLEAIRSAGPARRSPATRVRITTE